MVMGAGLVTQVIKRTFSRARPRDGGDPDLFFQGWSNESFISGDVAVMASLVTPWMLEYGKDAPAVYLLSALPLYTSMARLKVHAHWQSDVIGGLLIGGLAGYWAHQRDTPFLLFFTSDGVFVGLKKKF
jgi:undecaprenyl-diphosphatase